MNTKKRILSLLPVLFLLLLSLAACGGKDETKAASMWLVKTEGTVSATDNEGKGIPLIGRLGLFSGYGVSTEDASYGWINLDETKLTKMDENSDVTVEKDGKNLTLTVNSGSLFFNVTEPLADDETMEIRTSTMVTGIRGTKGWVTQDSVCLLEGTVTVTAGDQTVTISAGEMAYLSEDGKLETSSLVADDTPSFVSMELKEKDDGDANTSNDLTYYTVEGKTYNAFAQTFSDFDGEEWEVVSKESEGKFTLKHKTGFLLYHSENGAGTNLGAYNLNIMPDVSVGKLHFGEPKSAITEAYPDAEFFNDGQACSLYHENGKNLHIYFDEDGNIDCFDFFTTGNTTNTEEEKNPDVSYEEYLSSLQDVVYSEFIDFENDGNPELLTITGPDSEEKLSLTVSRAGSDSVRTLAGIRWGAALYVESEKQSISLMEADGKKYIRFMRDTYSHDDYKNSDYTHQEFEYLGSVAESDGDMNMWGLVDGVDVMYENDGIHLLYIANHPDDRNGLTTFSKLKDEVHPASDWPLAEAVINKYTLLRELAIIENGDITIINP